MQQQVFKDNFSNINENKIKLWTVLLKSNLETYKDFELFYLQTLFLSSCRCLFMALASDYCLLTAFWIAFRCVKKDISLLRSADMTLASDYSRILLTFPNFNLKMRNLWQTQAVFPFFFFIFLIFFLLQIRWVLFIFSLFL